MKLNILEKMIDHRDSSLMDACSLIRVSDLESFFTNWGHVTREAGIHILNLTREKSFNIKFSLRFFRVNFFGAGALSELGNHR